MALRTSIPQDELAKSLSPEDLERHGTDYQASRGGWLPPGEPKPVPGQPKTT